MTINNLNKFVVRHFDRLSTGTLKIRHCQGAKAPFRLRPSLTPALRLGVRGYTSYRGFSPDGTATCLRADSL
ncbi:MAG TPA: hypothetical protein ACFYEL_05795, partial [Candidatus Wunengus californicus]|uniref:hypothetical protein n=1 Tax=Candidatus Wunengus californicus TaxID=3367619 RepID=UPI004025D6C6